MDMETTEQTWIRVAHCTSCGATEPQSVEGYTTCCNEFIAYPTTSAWGEEVPCSYEATHCTHE